MEKTVVELFAGVGGFRVGLNNIKGFNKVTGKAIEKGDWKFVWADQWEPGVKAQYAYDCYVKRFGNECVNEDITKIEKSTIPNHSLLVGGFPCQDYSVAHSLTTEKGIEGKKGVLFWDIAKTLDAKKTPFILLENVDRLLKSPAKQRGRDFGIMLRTLNDLGYNLEWRVVNAADYGAPQRRKRVFIFGWRKETEYNKKIIKSELKNIINKDGMFAKSLPIVCKDNQCTELKIDIKEHKDTISMTNDFEAAFKNTGIMIDGDVLSIDTTAIKSRNKRVLKDVVGDDDDYSAYLLSDKQKSQFLELRAAKKKPRYKSNGEIYYYSEGSMSEYDSLKLPSRTMLTSERSVNRSTHIIMDDRTGKLRFLTPIEAERLQCFPDNWTDTGMPEKRRYFMMGNALVTLIIHKMEPTLSKIIENEPSK